MVITVTCPSCSSSFPVDPKKIPEKGVNARCSQCKDVFRVERPVEPVATLEDLAPTPAPAAAPAPTPTPPPLSEPVAAAPPPLPEPVAAEPPPLPEPVAEASPPEPEAWVVEHEEPAAVEPDPLPSMADDLPDLTPPPVAAPDSPVPAPPGFESDPFAVEAPFEAETAEEPAPTPAPEAPAVAEAPAVQGFTFGKRDPTDKAKRLARVLVSDMIMYNAERHQSALAAGTLAQDFEDEIEKSWKEYVDQVGDELANGPGREFWREALNDILAKGKQVF